MHTLRLYIRIVIALALLQIGATRLRANELAIVGTGDGYDVLQRIAELYRSKYYDAALVVPPSIGSGGAIAAVGSGRAMIGRVARPLTANEQSSGIRYLPIFELPSAFFVHPDVPVRRLTLEQLTAIFSGRITSWKDVGGPDERIRVVRREEADSSVAVFRNTLPGFRDLVFTERSKLALTTQEAIASIRDNDGAIGFGSYSSAVARRLGVISIGDTHPTDPNYPANVTLALIFRPELLNDEARRFFAFLQSEEAQQAMIAYGARPYRR